MGFEKFFSDEGMAMPLGLALMRMGGRSNQPRNLGVELGTAFQQQQAMKQAKQQQLLQQFQMDRMKRALMKEDKQEQYGQDYLNSANPQDPNLKYLAQTNPGALASLLAKQKMDEEQQSAEMARFGFGQTPGQMPQASEQQTPLAGSMQQAPPMPQAGPQGAFQGDPKQIAQEIMRIQDPAERQAAMQALNQQFNPQPQQVAAPQAPQGLPPQLAGITPERAFQMSMSQKSPSIAAAGKLMMKHYEDRAKREDTQQFQTGLRKDLQDSGFANQQALQANLLAHQKELQAERQSYIGQPKPMTAQQQAKFSAGMSEDFSSAGQTVQTMDNIKAAIKDISGSKGLSAREGYTGYVPAWMQGKDAMTAENRIDTLKGKVTQMGKAMATLSGAIGPMAVQEWKIVSDAVNAIDPKAGNFSEQLSNIEAQADGAINRIKDSYDRKYTDYFEKNPSLSTDKIKAQVKPGANPAKSNAPKFLGFE